MSFRCHLLIQSKMRLLYNKTIKNYLLLVFFTFLLSSNLLSAKNQIFQNTDYFSCISTLINESITVTVKGLPDKQENYQFIFIVYGERQVYTLENHKNFSATISFKVPDTFDQKKSKIEIKAIYTNIYSSPVELDLKNISLEIIE